MVWPFVSGYTVLALKHMAKFGHRVWKKAFNRMAEEELHACTKIKGFPEWVDPLTGQGWGASEQLWSACLFMRAMNAMKA